ncbi:gamma carbonic anhydrase family protein [Ehrlichia ruminantium]|uniref:Gamma carbonic anhydrase family protein n=1 Tax=Ehrlichia ruminantium TaxID=779 RepID=A0AAE6QBB3_EHRRU|nr:gamma carbonic anhydrase family protein [Ehrlichia ruminantium]QGR02889.1 gamma carbonic anhydrase family protein [Ehrlichia ruminantium]QGR03813.1 gamma carbonic anhydrase family protein [Ehrlichia ruminantium]QGR04740.1 gamma carbonic anhydrase family protein [Ehrlichia ruminantium]
MNIFNYKCIVPNISSEVFVASTAVIIGDVHISMRCSIWYNSVLRGDVGRIVIGMGTNIQDNTVIHVDRNHGDTNIGSMVTVGHGCILHACEIHDYVFVGMGSIIMDNVVIEKNAMIAAGSLVTKGKIVKTGELWAGRPAKFFRMLSNEEIEEISKSADNYIELARDYLVCK